MQTEEGVTVETKFPKAGSKSETEAVKLYRWSMTSNELSHVMMKRVQAISDIPTLSGDDWCINPDCYHDLLSIVPTVLSDMGVFPDEVIMVSDFGCKLVVDTTKGGPQYSLQFTGIKRVQDARAFEVSLT